jgi:ribosome biogenesis protein UTP30
LPLKQINLEFRHFEAKRKLCTSFDLFLADKCLHDILNQGSKLGKEFLKRRKSVVFIDSKNNKVI